ncbi:MAG: hypothetical protein ACOCR0_02725 [Haloferacaceae archaeon]
MNFDRTTVADSVGRDTVRSVSKILLSAAAVIFLLYLLTLLPGVDRLVPRTPVTFAALVGAIASVALVALLLYAAPKVAALVRMILQGPQHLVENVVSITHWLVVLAAVVVAHRGLAGAIVPFLEGVAWLYDVAFLLVALPVVVFIAARLYVSLDPGADLLADALVGDSRSTADGAVDEQSETTADGDDDV